MDRQEVDTEVRKRLKNQAQKLIDFNGNILTAVFLRDDLDKTYLQGMVSLSKRYLHQCEAEENNNG